MEALFGAATPQDYLACYIGHRYAKYLRKWLGKDPRHWRAGWNWSAFLGGPVWLVYRKLYLRYAALCAAQLLLVQAVLLSPLGNWAALAALLLHPLVGLSGDSWYQRRAYRALHKELGKPDWEIRRNMARRGGTNSAGVVVALALECGILLLPLYRG